MQESIQLIASVFGAEAVTEPGIDLNSVIEDDEHWSRNAERFSPDAEIRFITPEGTGLGALADSFRGIEGLRAGWREWSGPWEEFRIVIRELTEGDEGQVLALADAIAVMRETGTEIPQNVASLSRIEGGRIVAMSFYLDQTQARRDAGLD